MQFSKPFWPLSLSPYIQTTVPGLRFLSLHHYDKPGVLVAHLCPPLSIEMEKLSDQHVIKKVSCLFFFFLNFYFLFLFFILILFCR
jgi:hypothetical protein